MAEDFHAKLLAHRAHVAAVPAAVTAAQAMVVDLNGVPMADFEPPRQGLTCGHVRTLVREIERLQADLKRAVQDLREEQREAQRAAGDAYSEGRHDGISESRGY